VTARKSFRQWLHVTKSEGRAIIERDEWLGGELPGPDSTGLAWEPVECPFQAAESSR